MKKRSLCLWRTFRLTCWSALLVLLALVHILFPPKASVYSQSEPNANRPIVLATVDGSINPATDDYLRTSLAKAQKQGARLFILRLNTPGGLLTSMQTMVAQLLDSDIPTVVYVSPSGGGAISAGVFITMAGHFAVMAPGTTIGAAHPVMGGGQDVKGHMGEKVENFAVSLAKAIAEQRDRNVSWAEKAVRESVAITDREAAELKVVDFIAGDINYLLEKLEGKTVKLKNSSVTLTGLAQAPRHEIEWSFKQALINILSDPNIAILLGLAAMAGIGIEFYNPGLIVPGVVGVICLILSLTAGQVLPISQGGVALLLLGMALFVIEFFIPAFGIWGIAGVVCLVLGSIYFVDTEQVWSVDGFLVNRTMVGTIAALVGGLFLTLGYLAVRTVAHSVSTGKEGLIGKRARALVDFSPPKGRSVEGAAEYVEGKVMLMGEIWQAKMMLEQGQSSPLKNDELEVVAVEGLVAQVRFVQAE